MRAETSHHSSFARCGVASTVIFGYASVRAFSRSSTSGFAGSSRTTSIRWPRSARSRSAHSKLRAYPACLMNMSRFTLPHTPPPINPGDRIRAIGGAAMALLALPDRCGAALPRGSTDPAKPDRVRRRRQRAGRKSGRWILHVVPGGREVVRCVRMEQGGEVLGLSPTRPELELTAPIGADPSVRAVVVRVAQPPQSADPRGLEVHHPRRERQRLDVVDRVDRRVPGDPVVFRGEYLRGLGL